MSVVEARVAALPKSVDLGAVALGRSEADIGDAVFTLHRVDGSGPDVDLVHRWMNDPVVARYWDMAYSRSQIETYLVSQLAGGVSTPFLARIDGTPVGYWEIYDVRSDRLADYYVDEPDDVGVHLLIGEASFRGRGLAAPLLDRISGWLLGETVRRDADGAGTAARLPWRRVVAEPDATNVASVRAFRRAGFMKQEEIALPEKRAALMFRRRRPK